MFDFMVEEIFIMILVQFINAINNFVYKKDVPKSTEGLLSCGRTGISGG
jgi:hypothetical protein